MVRLIETVLEEVIAVIVDIACTSQLKRYGQFVDDLNNRLNRAEESLDLVDRSYIVQCQVCQSNDQ